MREKLNNSIFFGMIGNLLFILFAFVCIIYHLTYKNESGLSDILAAIAYTIEFCGFAMLLFADYLIWNAVRDRNYLKIGFSIYIVFEAVMMVMELNSYRIKFYSPYSMGLAIFHTHGVNLEKEPVKANESSYLKYRLHAIKDARNLFAHRRILFHYILEKWNQLWGRRLDHIFLVE